MDMQKQPTSEPNYRPNMQLFDHVKDILKYWLETVRQKNIIVYTDLSFQSLDSIRNLARHTNLLDQGIRLVALEYSYHFNVIPFRDEYLAITSNISNVIIARSREQAKQYIPTYHLNRMLSIRLEKGVLPEDQKDCECSNEMGCSLETCTKYAGLPESTLYPKNMVGLPAIRKFKLPEDTTIIAGNKPEDKSVIPSDCMVAFTASELITCSKHGEVKKCNLLWLSDALSNLYTDRCPDCLEECNQEANNQLFKKEQDEEIKEQIRDRPHLYPDIFKNSGWDGRYKV